MQGLVSDKTFHLKWNNHLQNLSQLFTTIYSSSALADVTLSCRDGTLKAHKLVLSACSPYFEQIFKDNPCQHPIVILKGIPFSEINLLVEFMYKGSVDVQELDLQSLMHTASELEIRGLAYEARDNAAQLLNVNLEYPTYSQTVVPTQQTFTQARTDVERLKQIHMYQQSMMRAEEIRRRRREDTPGTHTAVNNILAAAAREMEEARQAARGNDRVVASIQTEQEAATAATDSKRESEEDRPKKRVSILSPEDDKLRAKKKAMTVRFQDDNKTEERPNKVTSPGATNNEPRNEIETKQGGIKVVQLAVLQKPTNNEHDDSDEKPGKPGMEDDEETDSSGSISDSAANDSQDSRPHVCDICDLRFQRSSHLSRHRLTHTGERPFTCGGCGRSFARSDKLRVHTKICEREDPTVDMTNEQSTIKRENSSEVMSGMVRTTHRESGHLVFTASGDVMLPPGVSHAPAAPAPAAHGAPVAIPALPAHPALARDDLEPPRRGRGRPRKTPLPLTPKIKKRRGRPPKTSLDMEGCVLTSGTVMGPSPQHMSHLTPSGQQLLLKRKRGRPPKNYFMSQGDPSNEEPKNVEEAKQSGPKVVKLIVLRKVKTNNDDAGNSPEKVSEPGKKNDEGPDSGSDSAASDTQDGRSLATVIRDRKFQRSSHLFRRQHTNTEERLMFTCGSCGHKSALSNDALKHSRICKRGKRNEPATIKVKKSNCDVSDAVAPAPRAPDAPKRGRGRPRKRMSNFMREKNLDKKKFKPKRDVSRPRPVFKPQLTLAEQQLQLQRTRGRPPKNYYNRKKDIHKKPSLIMQGTLDNSTFQNMETVELQNLEDSSSEFITGSLSPILQSDEDANRNLSSPLYGFSEPTKIVFNPLADVHHSLFHDENNSQEEPEVIVPHFVEQTQMEPEEHVPTVGMETMIVSEKDSRIVKPIPNKEDIHDKTGQVQMEANLESTSTTSPSIITSIISSNDNIQRPVEHT